MNSKPRCQAWTCAPSLVDVRKLLGVHKYKDVAKVRPVILKSAEKATETARSICRPVARYRVVEIDGLQRDSLVLVGGYTFYCDAFAEYLNDCTHVLVFALTLGPGIDEAVSSGFAAGEDPLTPLFLDTAGWLTIEGVTRSFTSDMKTTFAKERLTMTSRMAPGYNFLLNDKKTRVDWPLSDQRVLFNSLECSDLPIDLLESSAMLPKMSRSGMFGVKPQH